jgi:hypothetical protein
MTTTRRIAAFVAFAGLFAAPAQASVHPTAGTYVGHTTNETHHRSVSLMLTRGSVHAVTFAGTPAFPNAGLSSSGRFQAHQGNYAVHGQWTSNTTVHGSFTHYPGGDRRRAQTISWVLHLKEARNPTARSAGHYVAQCRSANANASRLHVENTTCHTGRRVVGRFYAGSCLRQSRCTVRAAGRDWRCKVYPTFWKCSVRGSDALGSVKWRDGRQASGR